MRNMVLLQVFSNLFNYIQLESATDLFKITIMNQVDLIHLPFKLFALAVIVIFSVFEKRLGIFCFSSTPLGFIFVSLIMVMTYLTFAILS